MVFSIPEIILNRVGHCIGWHLMYEGIAKLFIPNWSSAAYLANSNWFLSDVFNWMATKADLLQVIDFINVWGLIAIGFCLFLGLFTRISTSFGIVLLSLYYIANPPFIVAGIGMPAEGNYYIIDKNLIEIIGLILILSFKTQSIFGFDKIGKIIRNKDDSYVARSNGRRDVLRQLATLPFMGVLGLGVYRKTKWEELNAISGATVILSNSNLKNLKGELQKGKIGDLNISGLLQGGSFIVGFAHARDLSYVKHLFKVYNNEKKIFETLALSEQAGVNTIIGVPHQVNIIQKYNKVVNGNMRFILLGIVLTLKCAMVISITWLN